MQGYDSKFEDMVNLKNRGKTMAKCRDCPRLVNSENLVLGRCHECYADHRDRARDKQ